MAASKNRAVVTGIGVIAANGFNREAFFQSLVDGKSGLNRSEMLCNLGTRACIAGQVDLELDDSLESEGDKTVQMAYKVLDEALLDSGLTSKDISQLGMRAGITLSVAAGVNYKYMLHARSKKEQDGKYNNWLVGTPYVATKIFKHSGVKGASYTTTSACASGTAGAGIAIDMIRSGKADLVVVVGSDGMTDFSGAGFHSLNCLSINGCKPFDKTRDGMTLGEGAAAFIVESLDRAIQRKSHIYGEILGYGLGNDAYHITSPNPQGIGAANTMNMALIDASLSLKDIDYINAHGTGTELNDLMETNAVLKLYKSKEESPAMSSTKAVTGHCLGAAGSVELAVVLLAIDRGFIPSTVGLQDPSDCFAGFNLVQGEGIKKEVKHAMSNSFAFGGHSASIIVGKHT